MNSTSKRIILALLVVLALYVGWTVFNVLHLGYHVLHLEGSTVDRAGTVVSLSLVTAMGLFLLVPPRDGAVVVATSSREAGK